MLFPGLGHFYCEQNRKGAGWMIGAFASLILINTSISNYNDKSELVDEALNAYNSATGNFSYYKEVYNDAFDERENSAYMIGASVTSLIGIWIGSTLKFKTTFKEYEKIQARFKGNRLTLDVEF